MGGELVPHVAGAVARPSEVLPARRRFATRAERDAAIIALAVAKMPPHEIERRIEVSRSVIYTVMREARTRGVAIPFFRTSGEPQGAFRTAAARTVVVPTDLLEALEQPARRRGLSAVGLAREIIRRVVEDDMVAAVLDDGVGG